MDKTIQKRSRRKKHVKMISAFSVLFGIIAIMAALTWVIPSGQYQTSEDGTRIAGTYEEVEKVEDVLDEETGEVVETIDRRQGLWDIAISPIKGMADKLDIIVFILILGGFLGIVMKSGALDAGLGKLLRKMRGREKWLIPILMTLFAIGGTTYGMQEETVAFYALIVPIMLAAGYNAMVAAMVIILGSCVGILASTVNPFATGIAARAAEVPLGNILAPQAIILVVTLIIAIIFVMRYAAKVKAGKYAEDAAGEPAVKELDMSNLPEYTAKRKAITAVFALTFVLMIISLVPWEDFGVTVFAEFHEWLVGIPVLGVVLGSGHNLALGEWYFNEISTLFLISAILMAVLNWREFKKDEVSITNTFIKGSEELLSVAIIIAVAAAISIIMNDGGIQDTIIHWGEQGLSGASGGLVGVLAYLFYLPMSFIIPSTSGLATATMPVIAPIADLVGSSKEVIVIAYSCAEGLLNMLAPTVASLMAGLTLAGVSYRTWLKRTIPFMLVIAVVSAAAIFVAGMVF